MVRTELSLFMKNIPGELGKLTSLFADQDINIDAISIQDASNYVQELFKARGKALPRIASASSYNSMRKDSSQYALIHLLVDKIDMAADILTSNDYIFDTMPVIAVKLKNRPGALAEITTTLGNEGINIHYIYGTVSSPDDDCLFIFCPEDIELASAFFK